MKDPKVSVSQRFAYVRLLEVFTKDVGKHFGKTLSIDDVLLEFTIVSPADSMHAELRRHVYCWFPCQSFRSGNHAASQTFVLADRRASGDGFVIALKTLPFCPPHGERREPMQRQTRGALDIATEQDLAVKLVKLVRWNCSVTPILTIRKLLFSDTSLLEAWWSS